MNIHITIVISAIFMAVYISADSMHPRFNRASGRIDSKSGEFKPYEDKEFWFSNAQNMLNSKINNKANIEKVAKNTIFFLGDGMSVATVTAARILKGQLEGFAGEETDIYFNTFPHTGVSKTFCTDSQVADSACSATAYLCGTKANDGTIGITPNALRKDCTAQNNPENQVSSVLQWAQRAGKSTGVVTTTRITHASPSGTYAHIADRDWENDAKVRASGCNPNITDDIAKQLILGEPGKNINVILGGGRREFIPTTANDTEETLTPGRREDGRNLIEEWQNMNSNEESQFLTSRNELLNLNITKLNKVLGLFSYDHLGYYDQQLAASDPTLKEMTVKAIEILNKNPNGFFLFVEGGRIDHAHHNSWGKRALIETIEFDKAIEVADHMTSDDDTLILVTSDHSHTMTINGYPNRGNPILGIAEYANDTLPYSTISYANGPGYQSDYIADDGQIVRHNISEDDLDAIDYRQISTAPLDYETHGGDDVLIFSKGPFAHLLTGVQMQSYIPHVIGYASCTGNGAHYEGCRATRSSGTNHNLQFSVSLIFVMLISYYIFYKLLLKSEESD